MKNTSKKKINLAILAVLTVLCAIYLYAAETFPITDRRADYFLIKTNTTIALKTGTPGYLYVKSKDTPVGTFKVIEAHGKEYLCKVESLQPQHLHSRLHRVSFTKMETRPPDSTEKPVRKIIKLGSRRLRFRPLPGEKNYYLIETPIPLRAVKPLNLSGIKKVLYNIEKVTGHIYSADLLDFQQIRQWELNKTINFAHKDHIYIGTVEGNLCMIFEEKGILKHTGISPATLEKFKDHIYFYLVITKKVKTQ